MHPIIKRFVNICFLTAIVAGLGIGRRCWQKRHNASAENPNGTVADENLEKKVAQMQEQLEEMKKQVAALPPEERGIIQDALAASNAQTIANPLIQQLSRMHIGSKAKDAPAESPIEQIEKFYFRWRKMESVMIDLLWLGAAGALVLGLIGFLRNNDGYVAAAEDTAFLIAHYWLLALAAINALAFATSGYNPWREMPPSFYMAPTVLLMSGAVFGMINARSKQVIIQFGIALTAPVACFSVLMGLGWFS